MAAVLPAGDDVLHEEDLRVSLDKTGHTDENDTGTGSGAGAGASPEPSSSSTEVGDGGTAASGRASVLSLGDGNADFEVERERAEARHLLSVRVEQPRGGGDGGGGGSKLLGSQPVVFPVSWKTTLSRFRLTESVCQRRYNDFLWLRDELIVACPGCIIPPLPEKALIKKFQADFLEQRRAALNTFMDRVCEHPSLRTLACVQTFLEAEYSPSQHQKEAAAEAAEREEAPPLKGSSRGSFFSAMRSAVGSAVSSTLPESLGGMVVQEIEAWFEEQKKDVREFSARLAVLQASTAELRACHVRLTDAYNGFSDACVDIAKCEVSSSESDQTVGNSFQELGDLSHELVGCNKEMSDHELAQADEMLQDYMRVMASVQEMLDRRDDTLTEYQRVTRDLEALKAKPNSPGDKIAALEAEVGKRKAAFDGTTKQARIDLQRFYRGKGVDMRRMLKNLAKTHLEHSVKVRSLWKDFVQKTFEEE